MKTIQSVPESSKTSEEQTDQYGPWILVERKRNRGPYKKGPDGKKLEGSSKMGRHIDKSEGPFKQKDTEGISG